jgi:hypothetical protein
MLNNSHCKYFMSQKVTCIHVVNTLGEELLVLIGVGVNSQIVRDIYVRNLALNQLGNSWRSFKDLYDERVKNAGKVLGKKLNLIDLHTLTTVRSYDTLC